MSRPPNTVNKPLTAMFIWQASDVTWRQTDGQARHIHKPKIKSAGTCISVVDITFYEDCHFPAYILNCLESNNAV